MDYAAIKDMVLSYADRELHTAITDRFDNMLRIVESRINRRLKQEGLSTIYNITTDGSQYYSLPSDFNGLLDIQLRATVDATDRQNLKFRTPEKLNEYANIADSSNQVFYTIINNKIRVWPVQTGTIMELTYHIKVPDLTSVAATNNVTIEAPDCYIFGALVEVNYFVKDYEAAKAADARFDSILDELMLNNFKRIYDAAKLEITSEDSV